MSTIKHKRGTGDPSASDLDVGELGINTTDGGVFTKTDGGSVVEVGGSSGGGVTSDAQGNTVAGTNAGDSFSGTSAEDNTLFGKDAGTAITSGDSNTCVGKDTGNEITDALGCTFIGFSTGKRSNGNNNTAVGRNCFSKDGQSTGTNNTAMGTAALQNFSGSSYTGSAAFGQGSLHGQTTGNENAAFGRTSGFSVTTGTKNTLLGNQAGYGSGTGALTTGSNNTIIGCESLPSSATVSNEVTIGNSSITKFRVPGINVVLKDNGGTPTQGHVLTVDANGEASFAAASGGGVTSDAQDNTVGGTNAGDSFSGTDAEDNTLYGKNAGTAITSGDQNTCIGNDAGKSIDTAARLTAIGNRAGENVTGQNNTIVGANSGFGITSGTANTIVGVGAVETGNRSNITAVGYSAGSKGAHQGTFVGVDAGKEATSDSLVYIGYKAGENATGSTNTVLGHNAFKTTNSGNQNVAIGSEALQLYADTGSNPYQGSTAVGRRALYNATTGNENVAVGRLSGMFLTTGTKNTILGNLTAFTDDGTGALTTGDNNIIIGCEALSSSATVSNEVTIGNSSITKFRVPGINFVLKDNGGTPTDGHVLTVDSNGEAGFTDLGLSFSNGNTIASSNILPDTNNSLNLGSSSKRWSVVFAANAFNTSDKNIKNTILDSDLGLSFINKLRPVSYKWNQKEEENLDSKTHYGFIAQEIETALISENKTLDDFAGVYKPDNYKEDGTGDTMAISINEILSPLVKAVQELSNKIKTLETEVESLKAS